MYRLILLILIATQTSSANSDETNDEVERAFDDVEQADDDVERAFDDVERADDDVQQAFYDVERADDDVERAFDDVERADDDVQQAFDDVERADDDVQQAFDDVERADNDVQQAFDDVERADDDVQQAFDDVERADDDVQQAFDDVERADDDVARAVRHAEQLMEAHPFVDGHNDIAWQYQQRVNNHVYDIDLSRDVTEQWGWSHTNIPRLRQGRVGAQFWMGFVTCDAEIFVRRNMEQVDTVLKMIHKYPKDFRLVTTAQGIQEAFDAGYIGSLIGIEGGHAIDSSLAVLRLFYNLGVRYMGLTHNCNTEWADNSKEDLVEVPEHGGLTDFGRTVILEMNRLGMMVDLSHVSQDTVRDTLNVSMAPVIFSHSSPFTLCEHVRNVKDDNLLRLKANEGIIMITFVPEFLTCDAVAGVEDVADHIEYIRDFIGVDYVGVSGDFDGLVNTVVGLEDVSTYPRLFAELVLRGWTDEDIQKVTGGNIIRVFRQVEQVRDDMSGLPPNEELLPGRGTRSITSGAVSSTANNLVLVVSVGLLSLCCHYYECNIVT